MTRCACKLVSGVFYCACGAPWAQSHWPHTQLRTSTLMTGRTILRVIPWASSYCIRPQIYLSQTPLLYENLRTLHDSSTKSEPYSDQVTISPRRVFKGKFIIKQNLLLHFLFFNVLTMFRYVYSSSLLRINFFC